MLSVITAGLRFFRHHVSALLTAFFLPIAAILVTYQPTLDDILFQERSRIEIIPSTSSRDYITLIAENTGNRPGSIGRVTVRFDFKGSTNRAISGDLRLDVREQEQGAIVVPRDSISILNVGFKSSDRKNNVLEQMRGVGELRSVECEYEVYIINYNGKESVSKLSTDCSLSAGEYLGLNNRSTIELP